MSKITVYIVFVFLNYSSESRDYKTIILYVIFER